MAQGPTVQQSDATNEMHSPVSSARIQLLREMEMPPELVREVDSICRRRGYPNGRARLEIEQEVKLQFHFGGLDVAYLNTESGLAVVAAGDVGSPSFSVALATLTPADRKRITIYSPDLWDDPTSSPGHIR